ncbi:MAG: hypothetical protein A2X34_02365 [Elusimicrobia bacterium GWC2_51_8]|nr:MAG: hypothetical protein A2X34_02365 [Elusimicrobia bacterium GWC2_51_8]
MKIIRLITLALAMLALAAAWTLSFAPWYKGRPGVNSAASAPPGVPPAKPAAAAVKVKPNAAKKSMGIKESARKRKKRVSILREPGEALGGETPEKREANL